MRTVLVTGGAGFVGSHLCESLLSDDRRVICLDDLSSGRMVNVDRFRDDERFTFVEGDVTEEIRVALGSNAIDPNRIERIYHLASRASPADFDDHPLEIARTNSEGTSNVLRFARNVDARVLYTSTSEVYGDPQVHPQPESYRGSVSPLGARACYDESKRFGETLCGVFAETYGIDVRIARLFNTYGPRMRPDDGRVVPNFLTQVLRGEDLTIYGDGTQTRCFLYIDDQVRGLRALMAASLRTPPPIVVNLGSVDEITIDALTETVIDVTGATIDVVYEPLPAGDPQRRQPDISRAKNELGWQPTIELEDGLRKTHDWFKKQLWQVPNEY